MILLKKNQLNRFALTLSELALPDLPNNWLLRFVDEQSESYEYLVQLPDVAPPNQDRYNMFVLIEGLDLTFDVLGDYQYFAYQMPDNTIEWRKGHEVERGKMRLIDVPQPVPTFRVDKTTQVYDVS